MDIAASIPVVNTIEYQMNRNVCSRNFHQERTSNGCIFRLGEGLRYNMEIR